MPRKPRPPKAKKVPAMAAWHARMRELRAQGLTRAQAIKAIHDERNGAPIAREVAGAVPGIRQVARAAAASRRRGPDSGLLVMRVSGHRRQALLTLAHSFGIEVIA